MDSMYKQYIEECSPTKKVIETEDGFVTYSIGSDNVYIEEIFVVKEKRRLHTASRLADLVAEIAKSKGINKLLGSVCPPAKGCTDSLKALLRYGFKIDSATDNFILLIKEIGD